MRLFYFLTFLFSFVYSTGFATTYYSASGGGNPNLVSNWFKNPGGNGQQPSDFTDPTDVFVIQNGHTYTTINAWNIAGTLQVEGNLTIQTANSVKSLYITSTGILTGTAQTTITAAASGGTFTIDSGGKYIFNNTTTNTATTLFAGTESFNANSNLEFQNFETTNDGYSLIRSASATNFGNVIWNIQAGATAYSLYPSNPGTSTICAGDFTVSKTGATGSLKCIRGGTGGTLTIGGDFIISAGTFDVFPAGSSSVNNFNISGDLILSGTGIFEMSSGSTTSTVNVNLSGNFTQSGGTFQTTSSSGTTTFYFSGSTTQTYTYSSGTFTTTNTDFNVKSGATLQLASNLTLLSGTTLTVASGGILSIPNPYYTTGAGGTTIASGATLKTGHEDGVSTTASTGCLQTTTNSCSTGATYHYNGTSTQNTGNINVTTTVGNLIFDNSEGVRMNSNLIIANGGTLTIVQGYHDIDSYTLQLGTSASANFLTYTAGGLYSRFNNGSFTRYIPTGVTITPSSGNYYGLFPFAKSSMQLAKVQITTSGTVTGGYITLQPTLGYQSLVTCSVADGGNTIVRVQEGSVFDVSACTVTGGTSITLAYATGQFVNSGTLSNLCLATYTSNVVGILGTHVSATGSVALPTVSRNAIANMSALAGISFVLGSYNTNTLMTYVCNLSGTKTICPSGCNYSTLSAAMTAISSSGLAGNLVLELQSSYVSTSESTPITIDPFNCLGSSNTLIIRPALGATNLSIAKGDGTALLYFYKGDYATIDGRPGGVGTTSQLTVSNTTNDKPTILFDYDANYNSVKYLTIQGDISGSSASIIEFDGSPNTASYSGNKYDTISYCTIKNRSGKTYVNGIYSSGKSASKRVTGIIVDNNKFIDFQSRGIYLSSHNTGWTISNNHFYQTTNFTPTNSVYGVHISDNGGGSGYTISGNYFGGQAASCGGNAFTLGASDNALYPFYLSVGATSTTSIQGNTIRNISYTNSASSGISTDPGVFCGIYVNGAGNVDVGTTSANIIGDTSLTASYGISILTSNSTPLVEGISINATGTVDIENNLIGDFITTTSKAYTFWGIYSNNSGTTTISSNTIGSLGTSNTISVGGTTTGANACSFIGIYNYASGTIAINSNAIGNVSVYGTSSSTLYGIYNNGGSGSLTISSNTIKGLSNYAGTNTSAKLIGIYNDDAITSTISSNSIHTITCANGFFKGIYLNNSSGTNTVSLNSIGNGTVGNITISSTATCNALTTDVINNHGGIVLGASSTISNLTSNTIRGISCTGASFAYRMAGIAVGNSTSPAVTLTSNTIEKVGVSSNTSAASIVYGYYGGGTSSTITTNKTNVIRYLFNANTNGPSIFGYYDNAYNHSLINNFISVTNNNGSTGFTVNAILYGIYTINGSTSNTSYFYYNTVEVGGTTTSNPVTATVYQGSANNTFIYKNNVFQNNCPSTNSLVFWGQNTTNVVCTMDYNFYMNYASATNFAKVSGTGITSGTFASASDDYGGINTQSTYTTTALTINSDASITTMATVYKGADLSGNSDCRADMYGTVGNRNSVSNNVYKGCYEGPVSTYYWVGGTGNWSDYSNHWAYASGGAAVATAAPTSTISVVFDQNSGSGTATINAAANCLDLTASGYTGTIAGASTLNVYGNFTSVTGMIWSTSGTINLLATSTGKTFTSGGVTIPSAVTLNGSGGEYTLQDNTTLSGALTLTNGKLIVGARTLTLSSNTSPTRTSGYIKAYGANSTVAFANTSSEIIIPSGLFYEDSVRNLTMNGSGGIQLSSDFTVTKVLTLTSGNIDLGTRTLTIENNGYATGYSASSYVMTESTGVLKQKGISTTSVTGKTFFPVGHTTGSYTPCTIVNTGTSDDFSVRILSDHYANGTSGTVSTTDKIDRTWVVDEAVVGGSNVTMTIQWNTAEELTGFDRTNCFLSHYTSGAWDSESATSASGSNPWTLSRVGITSFSPYSPDEGSALPIELVSFEAKQKGNYVSLDWSTASEYNNDFFTVERSENGSIFESLFTKKSLGNSSQMSYYHGLDKLPYEGLSYYRLKQTDNDGKYTFSQIQSVNFNTKLDDAEVNVYPNPTSDGNIVLEFDSKINTESEIIIIDPNGIVVYSTKINVFKGKNSNNIQLPNGIPSGMYIVELKQGDEGAVMHTFIKN